MALGGFNVDANGGLDFARSDTMGLCSRGLWRSGLHSEAVAEPAPVVHVTTTARPSRF